MEASRVVNQKLLDYIEDTLTKGFKKPAISARLKKAGYTDSEVNEAFAEIGKGDKKQDKPKLAGNKIAIILLAILIIAVLAVIILNRVIDYQKSTDPNLNLNLALIKSTSTSDSAIDEQTHNLKNSLWNRNDIASSSACGDYSYWNMPPAEVDKMCAELTYSYVYMIRNTDPDRPVASFGINYSLATYLFRTSEARDSFYKGMIGNNLMRPFNQEYSQTEVDGTLVDRWVFATLDKKNATVYRNFMLLKFEREGEYGMLAILSLASDPKPVLEEIITSLNSQ